jgi:hypothetical protein
MENRRRQIVHVVHQKKRRGYQQVTPTLRRACANATTFMLIATMVVAVCLVPSVLIVRVAMVFFCMNWSLFMDIGDRMATPQSLVTVDKVIKVQMH